MLSSLPKLWQMLLHSLSVQICYAHLDACVWLTSCTELSSDLNSACRLLRKQRQPQTCYRRLRLRWQRLQVPRLLLLRRVFPCPTKPTLSAAQ